MIQLTPVSENMKNLRSMQYEKCKAAISLCLTTPSYCKNVTQLTLTIVCDVRIAYHALVSQLRQKVTFSLQF